MEYRTKLMNKYFNNEKVKSVNEVQEIMAKDTEKALLRAKSILCIENEKVSKPLIIVSPNFTKKVKIRYRIYETNNLVKVDIDYALLTTIFLSDKRLFYHQTALSYLDGSIESDSTGEISLLDIINIETVLLFDNEKKPITSNLILRLDLINGSKIEFTLRNHFSYESKNELELLTEDEHYIIEIIKNYVRNKK